MCVMACYSVLCGLVAFGDVLRELQPKRLSPVYYPYKIKERLEAPRDSLGEFPFKNQMKRTRGLKTT